MVYRDKHSRLLCGGGGGGGAVGGDNNNNNNNNQEYLLLQEQQQSGTNALETIVTSVELEIRLIFDAVKDASSAGGNAEEADIRSVDQACVDTFSSHNQPTIWNGFNTVGRLFNSKGVLN